MILGNNPVQRTHYEVIGVKEDASQEEIRKTYRSTILSYHPDKLQKPCETSNPELESGEKFLHVQRAWEILSDPRSRALYDSELQTLRQDTVTAEDVRLEDMSIEDDGEWFELSYSCRCGDCFSINSLELTEMGYSVLRDGNEISLRVLGSSPASVVLPCGSCSLKVRILIDADITLCT